MFCSVKQAAPVHYYENKPTQDPAPLAHFSDDRRSGNNVQQTQFGLYVIKHSSSFFKLPYCVSTIVDFFVTTEKERAQMLDFSDNLEEAQKKAQDLSNRLRTPIYLALIEDASKEIHQDVNKKIWIAEYQNGNLIKINEESQLIGPNLC